MQNRWIIDNLETDALRSGPKDDKEASAFVTVVQEPTPSLGAVANSLVSYSIVATNRGSGTAQNAVISVPFDPATLQVVDARFSREGAWVRSVMTTILEIATGLLASGDTLTKTLRLRVLPRVAAGTSLAERLDFRWSDGGGGGRGRSNLTLLAVEATVSDPPTYPLVVIPGDGRTNSTFSFTGPIFAPDESVGLWYDTPDGNQVAVDMAVASSDGVMSTIFSPTRIISRQLNDGRSWSLVRLYGNNCVSHPIINAFSPEAL